MKTHKIDKDILIYPQHHRWLVNPSKLNLYANTTVTVGDILETKQGSFRIEKCSQDSDITAEVRGSKDNPNPEQPNITDKTIFYHLEIVEVS